MKKVIKSTLGYLREMGVKPAGTQPLFSDAKKDAIVFTKPEFVASVMAILTAKEAPEWAYLKCEEITLVNFVLQWKKDRSYCGKPGSAWTLQAATRFKSYKAAKARAGQYVADGWQIIKVPA